MYGGGGIVPDVFLPKEDPTPLWLARVHEQSLVLKWAGPYLDANPKALTSMEALIKAGNPPAGAVESLRDFIRQQKLDVPDDEDAWRRLERAALYQLAYTKFGSEGVYSVIAVTDPQVKQAVEAFDKAEAILRASQ